LLAFSSESSKAAQAIISSQENRYVTMYLQAAPCVICAAPHKKGPDRIDKAGGAKTQ
jgi:hypothetical protein